MKIYPATPSEYTEEQLLLIMYDSLLDAVKITHNDKTLEEFRVQADIELEEFEENYPEIVSEFQFNKGQI